MGADRSKYIPKEYFILFLLITTCIISGASTSKIAAIKESENRFDHSNKNLHNYMGEIATPDMVGDPVIDSSGRGHPFLRECMHTRY
jgi:hypothetical protein